ncbi:hypothetical protein [Salinicola acroporae]
MLGEVGGALREQQRGLGSGDDRQQDRCLGMNTAQATWAMCLQALAEFL